MTVICFQPRPDTTQGEAEAAARLAKRYGWHSIALLTTPDQTVRAEIRFRRCFPGEISAVTTPLPRDQWPYAIAYQWVATAKAEFANRQYPCHHLQFRLYLFSIINDTPFIYFYSQIATKRYSNSKSGRMPN